MASPVLHGTGESQTGRLRVSGTMCSMVEGWGEGDPEPSCPPAPAQGFTKRRRGEGGAEKAPNREYAV